MRRRAILEHFGSPERFIAASRDEIEQGARAAAPGGARDLRAAAQGGLAPGAGSDRRRRSARDRGARTRARLPTTKGDTMTTTGERDGRRAAARREAFFTTPYGTGRVRAARRSAGRARDPRPGARGPRGGGARRRPLVRAALALLRRRAGRRFRSTSRPTSSSSAAPPSKPTCCAPWPASPTGARSATATWRATPAIRPPGGRPARSWRATSCR